MDAKEVRIDVKSNATFMIATILETISLECFSNVNKNSKTSENDLKTQSLLSTNKSFKLN